MFNKLHHPPRKRGSIPDMAQWSILSIKSIYPTDNPMANYDEIYNAAKSLDKTSLASIAWFDERKSFFTPAARLAQEGNDNAVKLLEELGADQHDSAFGYAAANNQKKIDEYLQRDPAHVHWIAKGYAFMGNHAMVEYLRTQLKADVDSIAEGYALADNTQKVEEYRTNHHASVENIARAYAEANNHEQVNLYRTQHDASIDWITHGYILANNSKKVDEYHENQGANPKLIAKHYAMNGQHDGVEQYRRLYNVDAETIVKGYAQVNNHKKVKDYAKKYDVPAQSIAYGYALGHHHKQAIDAIMQGIIQEIDYLQRYQSDQSTIDELRELYQQLISPSPNVKTLGSLLNKLDLSIPTMLADHYSIMSQIKLQDPGIQNKQTLLKEQLQQNKQDTQSNKENKETTNIDQPEADQPALRNRGHKR